MRFAKQRGPQRIVRFLVPLAVCLILLPLRTRCQDSGAEGTLLRGDKAEISVTVRDNSGEPISAPATVKLFKEGMPTDQKEAARGRAFFILRRSEEHTSELQSRLHLVCRLLLEKKKTPIQQYILRWTLRAPEFMPLLAQKTAYSLSLIRYSKVTSSYLSLKIEKPLQSHIT